MYNRNRSYDCNVYETNRERRREIQTGLIIHELAWTHHADKHAHSQCSRDGQSSSGGIGGISLREDQLRTDRTRTNIVESPPQYHVSERFRF